MTWQSLVLVTAVVGAALASSLTGVAKRASDGDATNWPDGADCHGDDGCH